MAIKLEFRFFFFLLFLGVEKMKKKGRLEVCFGGRGKVKSKAMQRGTLGVLWSEKSR